MSTENDTTTKERRKKCDVPCPLLSITYTPQTPCLIRVLLQSTPSISFLSYLLLQVRAVLSLLSSFAHSFHHQLT